MTYLWKRVVIDGCVCRHLSQGGMFQSAKDDLCLGSITGSGSRQEHGEGGGLKGGKSRLVAAYIVICHDISCTFGRFEMLMISLRRGTPSVTFFDDTPAKWKVLSVICVAGSPMDWAAMAPTISPGVDWAWLNFDSISPNNHSNACKEILLAL